LRGSLPRAQDPQCSPSCANTARSLQMQVRTARNAAPERLAVKSVKSLCRALAIVPESLLACLLSCHAMPCSALSIALPIIILRIQANPQGNPHPAPPRAPIANRPCVVTCTQNLLSRRGHANSRAASWKCNLLPLALRGPMASLCLDRVGSID